MARPTDGMAPRSRDDDDAQQYLALLRDGTRAEKILARNSLARIFERRGMLDEAAELYESNIQLGVQDPVIYERLADVYRRRGRADLADELLAEARRLQPERSSRPARAPSPSPPPPDASQQCPGCGDTVRVGARSCGTCGRDLTRSRAGPAPAGPRAQPAPARPLTRPAPTPARPRPSASPAVAPTAPRAVLPRCPLCGNAERVIKVSTIYESGRKQLSERPTRSGGSAASAQSGLLAILAPPAEPPSPTSGLGAAGLLVLAIVSIAGVAVVAALGFALSLRTEALLALLGILLAILTYAAITLRGRAGRASGSDSPRAGQALDRWNRAYYCERHQVVFLEGESLAVPLPKIAELLAR